MALEGSLREFGLADILQLIYFQRKTGILELDGKTDRVKLLFIDGNITGAESKRRTEDNRLGKILLKKGYVKEKDLKEALEDHRKTGKRLGEVLLERGLVEKEVVREIVNNQISETVVQLFSWKEGMYVFNPQAVPQEKLVKFSLDTQHLLMEGLRILDEWSLIKDKITLDTVFVLKAGPATGETDQEKEILRYVDGENDVSTIIDLCGYDNFEASKTLLALMERDVIEARESPPVVGDVPVSAWKKIPALRFLPYAAVALSVLLAVLSVLVQKGEDRKVFAASQEIERIRAMIETHRFRHAAYPQTLESVTREGDPWGRPFLYRASGDAFILSSSGPDGIGGTGDDVY